MTLLWVEGWEARKHADHFASLYFSHPTTVNTGTGRLHGSCFNGTAGGSFVTPILEQHQTYIAGIAAQINSPATTASSINANPLLGILDTGSVQVAAYVVFVGSASDDYTIEVYRGVRGSGGVLLNATGTILGSQGYHYYELGVTVANTGGTWELRQDGNVISSGTGDTQVTANASANQARYGICGTTSPVVAPEQANLDDVYVCSGSGTDNNTFLGDSVVEAIFSSAAGDRTEWVSENNGTPTPTIPNWEQVNDPPTTSPDNDAGYITAIDNGDGDLYHWTDLGFVTGDIKGIMAVSRTRVETPDTRTIRIKYKDPVAGESNGPSIVISNSIFDSSHVIMETNPTSDAPWSVAEIDGGQFGQEIVS